MHIVIMDSFDQDAADRDSDATSPATLPLSQARFARMFASYCGARVTARLRLHKKGKEKPTEFGKIIGLHERIKKYTNRDEGELPKDKELMSLGDSLYKTLFPPAIERLYVEARTRQAGRKLDVVFTSMVPWIAEKPWEFAYDKNRKRFLATDEVNFIRNVLTNIPSDAVSPSDEHLRILVAAAQPVGFGTLSIKQEAEVIRRGFESLVRQGLADVDVMVRTTPQKLQRRLQAGRYDIVHFIGHGDFDPDTEEGALIFEGENGEERRLSGAGLRQIFCGRGLSLVFLNACLSGAGGRADFNKGAAQALVEQGLPALVANQYSVLDSSATSFAQHFYWSLAHGMAIGNAAREARIAVNCSIDRSIDGEIIDWAVPVLYARDPNMVLCTRQRARRPKPDALKRARAAQIARHKFRIAVWDMDNVFPKLEQTLAKMNAAQSAYGFELTDMSTPLDIWYLDQRSRDGTPYLWAEKLARRVHSKTAELGVDLLACATRHWLADNDTLNLYGWWPDRRTPKVVIFSCAGFDALKPEGAETDRVLANATVSALAGYFARTGTHDGGNHNCPLFSNEQRDFGVLTAHQSFDAGCRKIVEKKIGTDIEALDKLLAAFRGPGSRKK